MSKKLHKMTDKSAKSYHQVYDHEWVHMPTRGMDFACCDCGLTHRIFAKYDSETGRVFIKTVRNNRSTGQIRRWIKKK